MKTCPCNEHLLTPHFYIHVVKMGFTGVYIFFLIFALKHRSWVLVRTASRVPTIYVLSKNKKKKSHFSSENYIFYNREIFQYIARTCLRNDDWHPWDIDDTCRTTVMILNFRTPENYAVNYLKFKQRGQTIEYFVQKMQME